VLINVTDTGIGISAEDIGHIFQKFYRSDNSDTRTIGGTGLGLYLVKQRVEAMGGRVWAESGFGEGSTFFVSLPRISGEEYEKRMIVVRNQEALEKAKVAQQPTAPVQPAAPVQAPAPTPAPVPVQVSAPAQAPVTQTPAPTPVASPAPAQSPAPALTPPAPPTTPPAPPAQPTVQQLAQQPQPQVNNNQGGIQ
jgi:hypothetical protein